MSHDASTIEMVDTAQLASKHLIDEALWNRMTKRIAKDEKVDVNVAERILDQALAFLQLCAASDGTESYSPSPLVDIGWHTFILYTKPYADFCQRVAGHFIHHSPSDEDGVDYGTGNIARTVEALRRHGIIVDEPLWANTGHDCSSYCSEGNCDNHA
jgi:hypothetical protein